MCRRETPREVVVQRFFTVGGIVEPTATSVINLPGDVYQARASRDHPTSGGRLMADLMDG